GGGLSSSFGGGGGAQIGGVQKTSDFLDKSTWTLATIMLALILFSNVFIMGGNSLQSKTFDESAVPAVPTTQTPAPAATDTTNYNLDLKYVKMPASDKLAFLFCNMAVYRQCYNFCPLSIKH